MTAVKLYDSTFPGANSFTLAGENLGQHPESFQWDRTGIIPNTRPTSMRKYDLAVFTDLRLRDAIDHPAKKKIAIIIESPGFATGAHKDAIELREHFDTIFTHNAKLLGLGDPFKFYPFGGSWIRRWGIFPKTKNVSIIVGSKTTTEGQKLRHIIARRFATKVDVFGKPFTEYLPSKVPMLRPYRYSIVIENMKSDYFFTEKLIDCISQGTIPIYWGCPSVAKFFRSDGIIPFNTVSSLEAILSRIGEKDFQRRLAHTIVNLASALHFRCAEDWITSQYPGVFEL